jgi:hypothetical protein
MGYTGARGTLIYEKNLKPKILCQTPFKSENLRICDLGNLLVFVDRPPLVLLSLDFGFKQVYVWLLLTLQ